MGEGVGSLAHVRIIWYQKTENQENRLPNGKKRGRPSKDSEAVNLRLPRELLEALDDRRRAEPDLPTRPEMIRRALVQWFELTQTRED